MNEQIIFNALLISMFALAAITTAALFFITAPYGRHTRKGWGPTTDERIGWIVMEAPAPLVFAVCFVVGAHSDTLTAWVFLLAWEAHYLHRAFIYPLGLRTTGRQMPMVIAGMGFLFNSLNGYLNGRYLFTFSGGYPSSWLKDARFVVGMALFLMGYVINRQADHTLRHLRPPGESGYAIPQGGMYRWISCPNYFGEILEWFGWAIATWSLAGLAFFTWTTANLAPRAQSHHLWYREEFEDYPTDRRALLPRLW
jgi:3-oxo-5-alpha-steroid 4-dehydrogenase 1